jgi:hypothetical protein
MALSAHQDFMLRVRGVDGVDGVDVDDVRCADGAYGTDGSVSHSVVLSPTNNQRDRMLLATQHALTIIILFLHSFGYIFVVNILTLAAAMSEYLSSSNASLAAIITTIIIIRYRHDYRCVLHLTNRNQIQKQNKNQISQNRKVRFLTYNFFCRPPLVRNNEDDYKEERLLAFFSHLDDYDVIAFQEIFELFNTRFSFS